MNPEKKKPRRHVAVREELRNRVEMRLALARALAHRTRMMIARLDRHLDAARRLSPNGDGT